MSLIQVERSVSCVEMLDGLFCRLVHNKSFCGARFESYTNTSSLPFLLDKESGSLNWITLDFRLSTNNWCFMSGCRFVMQE